jgi:hypothetical protein
MTPFEQTLLQVNKVLDNRLNSNYSKIKVQGCHKPGNTQLVFTIFDNNKNYHLEFTTLKNLRMFKPEGEENVEIENIDKIIRSISVLNNYL